MPKLEWVTRVQTHTGKWENWREMPVPANCPTSCIAKWAAGDYLERTASKPAHGASIRVEVWHLGTFTNCDVKVQYRRPTLTPTRAASDRA